MADPRFFDRQGPFSLDALATATGAALVESNTVQHLFVDVAPLDRASQNDISFFDNPKYLAQFEASGAGACFVREKYRDRAPTGMALLLTDDPYRAYAAVAALYYPAREAASTIHASAVVDAAAQIDKTAQIDAGAVIGPGASIGAHCVIGANTVIGRGVVVGAGTHIGPLCSLSHCIIGERVILHRGVHIGQDGFGFAMGARGHLKVPQLGRVVIGNDVEIGSGTTIDRGAGPDTEIGDGTKIDNLVQIAHNVTIGKNAVIVAQAGVSGSTQIGDFAVLAGQSGIAGHLHIGAGARIAAQSGVMTDIPPQTSYGGSPAQPIKDWHRQTVALSHLVKAKRGTHDG
jgi:UDP-3-O-[3-hydroxymyristoyl] glucosamine N-acyltransferase